ncbi:cytochrome P450 [Artomyces pyxidatus]|uniref:Cytochrome P450 n=1 Tax=Artomyces pyxidatus TaxID=48021 RepID=A0ACB8SRS1_9AGAM|nr:cytochrome P450 [Artomyces pyxidatus]
MLLTIPSPNDTLVLLFQPHCFVIFGVTAVFCIVVYTKYRASPWRKLPPGPRGLPLIGNVFDVSNDAPWLTFTQWKAMYGEVTHFSVLGQSVVVLNTQKAATELLGRRAARYSDRVRNIVGAETMCGGLVMIFQNYSTFWRRLRRAAHEGLTNSGVKDQLRLTQHRHALTLALGFLDSDCNKWQDQIRQAMASVILSTLYGHSRGADPRVKSIEELLGRLGHATLPKNHLVEIFPWMRYIPARLAPWKRQSEAWFEKDSDTFENLFNTSIACGTESPTMSSVLHDNSARFGLSVRESAWLNVTMYAAGVDTTTCAFSWGILGILAYPETQKRAQAELDVVVGRSRVPTFADLPHLPYVSAMVRETLRWGPVTPVALPHLSTQDDWYEGMFIPAGTVCVPNVWAMHRDTNVFGLDAAQFNPSRHLDARGKLASQSNEAKDDGIHAFGFGRRVCPGKQLATDSIAIMLAVALWACSFERKKDAYGEDVPLDLDGYDASSGVAIGPAAFQCRITPRFPSAAVLLEQEQESHVSES